MITLFDLLVVAAILGFAYWGWLVGVEAASVAALELLACLMVAVMLHETVAAFLHAGFVLVLGDWVGTAWAVVLAFAGLAWGAFGLVRFRFHEGRASDGDDATREHAEIDPLADRVTGALAGGVGGAVLAGAVLVTLSMIPFLAGLKPSGDRMLLDVGKLVLRAAGQFAGERHEGRSLPLWGEPPSQQRVKSARLASEPWFDVDDDNACTEADRFRDVDGNGTFTKDLYFIDVDGDGARRIGLIDKYVAGRWDGLLRSDDRERPDLKKPPEMPPPTPPRPPAPANTRPAAADDRPAGAESGSEAAPNSVDARDTEADATKKDDAPDTPAADESRAGDRETTAGSGPE